MTRETWRQLILDRPLINLHVAQVSIPMASRRWSGIPDQQGLLGCRRRTMVENEKKKCKW